MFLKIIVTLVLSRQNGCLWTARALQPPLPPEKAIILEMTFIALSQQQQQFICKPTDVSGSVKPSFQGPFFLSRRRKKKGPWERSWEFFWHWLLKH